MTLKEWLDKGEARLLRGPNPDRARLDAEVLLLHLIGRDRAFLIAHGDDQLTAEGTLRYYTFIDRRLGSEPIQYILGEAEFYGLPFRVNRDVLIPRPETEHSVEKVLERAGSFEKPRILDVGTGSGAIAVAIAAHLPQASVTATDISPAALALARENAARNNVLERIRFLAGDLRPPVAGEQFEIVVSNPPYVAENDRNSLSAEVRNFEPPLALFAGADGLALYRCLISQAFNALVPGGFIVLEIGYGQQDSVADLLAQAGFADTTFTPDLQGIPRVASARRS